MLSRPLKVELAEIHAKQRQLRLREAEVLEHLANDQMLPAQTPRPGWPMQRLPEYRAN